MDPVTLAIAAGVLFFVSGAATAVSSASFGLASSEPPFNTPEGTRQFLRDQGAGSIADHIPG